MGAFKKKFLNAFGGNLIRKGTHVDTYKRGGACCQEVKIRPISTLISGGGAQIVASLATWSGPWRTRGGEEVGVPAGGRRESRERGVFQFRFADQRGRLQRNQIGFRIQEGRELGSVKSVGDDDGSLCGYLGLDVL